MALNYSVIRKDRGRMLNENYIISNELLNVKIVRNVKKDNGEKDNL